MISEMPKHRAGFPFLSQEQFDALPLTNWVDINGRVIMNHPELPDHMKQIISKYTDGPRVTPMLTKEPPKFPSCEEEEPQIDLEQARSHQLRKGQKYSVKDLVKAQEADSLILAIKFLMNDDEKNLDLFPKVVRKRAQLYYRGRKKRLFVNTQEVLCCAGNRRIDRSTAMI